MKYAARVKSSAASMLSNASLLYKAAEALKVEEVPPTPPPAPEPPKIKTGSGGLVVVDPAKMAAIKGTRYFYKYPWASLAPERGKYFLDDVQRTLDANAGATMTFRPQAGDVAPQWLKDLTGSVDCFNQARGIAVKTCKWWTDPARESWRELMAVLAEKFDGDERVVMVTADLPMVVYSEPYILGNDKDSAIRLFNAGLTKDVQVATIAGCVDDTSAAWTRTLVELPIHSDLQYPTATGVQASWEVGRTLALDLAKKHGKHLVFSDYGLGTADTLAAHTPTGTIETEKDVYAWMHLRAKGGDAPWAGPISFQLTVGKEPQTQETYRQAAQNAIDLGAHQCETAGWGLLGALAPGLDAALKANAPK